MNEDSSMSRLSPVEIRRRKQIINTTITLLSEVGYVNTSLVKIAGRADISIGLIAYHFKNKEELMRQTLTEIMSGWHQYIADEISRHSTAPAQLSVYIRANLEYMAQHPQLFPALIEIVFNARNEYGVLLYRADEDDPALTQLEEILKKGRDEGTFKQTASRTAALAIRASIDQYLGQLTVRSSFNATRYIEELIELMLEMVTENAPAKPRP